MRGPSQTEQRYRCTRWGQTFVATQGPPFYRRRPAAAVVPLVLTLRRPGGPLQAMVAAFGCDARPVAAGVSCAGQHGQQGQQHLVQQGHGDLPPGQADAWWVTLVGPRVWMALALAGPSRLGLGGVISPPRDLPLSTPLVQRVRACARTLALLLWADGLASSVTACRRVVRHLVRSGRCGRPRLVAEQGWRVGQVGTRDARRRGVRVERRGVRGTTTAIGAGLAATHTGPGLNTADLERLHATCRASLAPLVRRGRAIAHTEAVLTAGLWLVGGAYHFCWLHDSRRVAAPAGAGGPWQECPPAMAAGLTHHRWTMRERLRDQGPLPAWVVPTRRGRPAKRALQPAMAVAA